jgi:hypothetical protein
VRGGSAVLKARPPMIAVRMLATRADPTGYSYLARAKGCSKWENQALLALRQTLAGDGLAETPTRG